MSSDFNDNLDAMLTDDGSKAVEDPATDVTDDGAAKAEQTDVDGSPAPKTEQAQSAGGQPESHKDDGDAPAQTKTKATSVPLATFVELRRASREHMRAMHERQQELEQKLADLEKRREVEPEAKDAGEDDDEPLTRADLRRIEAERATALSQQTQQQRTELVTKALMQADADQQRLLQMAEPYLSRRDKQRIVASEDTLATAVSIARARLDMFGTDDEVTWLEGHSSPAKQQQKSASESGKTKQEAAEPKARQQPAQSTPGQDDDDDVSPNMRGVLDHMFA